MVRARRSLASYLSGGDAVRVKEKKHTTSRVREGYTKEQDRKGSELEKRAGLILRQEDEGGRKVEPTG